jgi:hypothetical protein
MSSSHVMLRGCTFSCFFGNDGEEKEDIVEIAEAALFCIDRVCFVNVVKFFSQCLTDL